MTRFIPPLDPDPLEVQPEPVRRHVDEPRSGGVIVWIAVAIVVGFVLAVVFLATPRSASSVSPRSALSGAPFDEGSLHPVTVQRGLSDEGPALSSPPPAAPRLAGTATHYCLPGQRGTSYCTRGYGPEDMVAAIDRKDTPWDKGDRLRVSHAGRSVTVRVVDVCGCRGSRLIDLTSGAFRQLAPLGRGVIPVTIELAGSVPTLPPTDAGPTTSNGG